MRTQKAPCLATILSLALLPRVGAQTPPERERVFCDPADPCHQCPQFCACLDDTLEVTFDGETASVLEYESFHQGMRVDTVIVTDTMTSGIQGWSYAVEHEDAFLNLLDVTVDGTEAERAKDGGFVVAEMSAIEACLPGSPQCSETVPGVGYIAATILHLAEPAELPLGRNRICAATYALASDPGPNGTLIQIVNRRLKKKGSPPVEIHLSRAAPAGAFSAKPGRIIDGWLKKRGEGAFESCDNQVDDDGDGKADCDDWDCLAWRTCLPEHGGPGGPGCSCSNFRDDDGDGLTDCSDPDCRESNACPPREICANSLDDDGDGLADCRDPDCGGSSSCKPVEICNDIEDNDRDGFIDCDDTDCFDSPICSGPEKCGSLRDEDQDGLVDCEDPDCTTAADCLPGPERTRTFCNPSAPQNRCSGDDCKCVDDILQVTLGSETESVLEPEILEEGARIDSTIVLDTVSAGIQGWSFAVEHDEAFLTLLDAIMDGTDAEKEFRGGYRQVSTGFIEACEADDPDCTRPVPGSGYVVGVVLSLLTVAELPPGRRNSLCRAEYALKGSPGPDGTLVRLVDRRLKVKNSPPVPIGLTIRGLWRMPATLIDGWVKARNEEGAPATQPSFRRGDADRSGRISVLDAVIILLVLWGKDEPAFDCQAALDVTDDGRVDVIDAVRLLQFLLDRGPDLSAPFPGCGPDPTPDRQGPPCLESSCEA